MFYDIIELDTFNLTRKVLDTLPLPEGYNDPTELLIDYLHLHPTTTIDDNITTIIEISSLYDEPRFKIRDSDIIMYHLTDGDELHYIIYEPGDGGTLTIDQPIQTILNELY